MRAWWRVRVKLSEGGKQTVEGDKGRTCCPSPPSSLTHTGAVGSARCKSASLHSSGERGDVRDGKEKINWAKCACCCLWSQSFLSPSLPALLSHYFLLLCNPATFLSTADINIYNVAIPILSVLFIPSCSLSLSHGCSVDECNSCCLVCAEQICWEIRFSVLIWKECLYKLRSGVTICSQTFCSFIFSSPINLCFFLPHYLSCSFPCSPFSIPLPPFLVPLLSLQLLFFSALIFSRKSVGSWGRWQPFKAFSEMANVAGEERRGNSCRESGGKVRGWQGRRTRRFKNNREQSKVSMCLPRGILPYFGKLTAHGPVHWCHTFIVVVIHPVSQYIKDLMLHLIYFYLFMSWFIHLYFSGLISVAEATKHSLVLCPHPSQDVQRLSKVIVAFAANILACLSQIFTFLCKFKL